MAWVRVRAHRVIACAAVTLLASAAVASPADAHDVVKVKAAIRRAWQGNDRKAIRVARCESGLDPKATSSGGTYLGLWQFSRATWDAYDGPGDDPRDVSAFKQTKVAWRLYKDQGWAPWPSCAS